MKIKHLFGLAVIAAMTASCSSNEDLGTAGPGTGTNETGVGYATFTINLPSVSGTRADAGGAEMDEGTANEYAVKSATALIFQKYGSDEGSCKFVESVDLPTAAADWTDDATDGITTTKKLVAKLTNVDTKNQYYVLVLLNNNKNKTGGVKVALPTVGQSYNEWNSQILTLSVDDLAADNDFYMANAPLKGTASPTTLVTIDKENIYSSKEKAEAGTSAATVYVERGVAKMSVTDPTTKTVIDKATNNPTKSTVEFNNWALDITNRKTYAVHNIDDLSTDFPDIWTTPRFIGTNSRVYWGKDPNYNLDNLNTGKEAEREKEFNFIKATSGINKTFTESAYCLENTFNLANMYQGQTTRVIFKATYTPKDDAGNPLAEQDGTFYTIGNMTNILNEAALKTAVNTAATSVLPGCTVDYTNLKQEGSHVITLADIKDSTGTTLVADKVYSDKTGTEIVKEINDKLGLIDGAGHAEAMVGINTYAQGVTYYIARVKHFGSLTPWNSGESYGTDNGKYLGRYGMLRNNWYELTVGNVYGPGYPGVPPVDPNQPDDENEKYLSVSVKILSWAKRSDTVDL
jgi:hypothetical protein